jgi:hypothetical protein
MSCQALCHDLSSCRNYSLLEAEYCWIHNQIPERNKQKIRWIKRYIRGYGGYGPFYHNDVSLRKRILSDLANKRVVLTKEDIEKIPALNKYLDIYTLLCKYDYAEYKDNPALMLRAYVYMMKQDPSHEFGLQGNLDLIHDIHNHIVLKNANSFYDFLAMIPLMEEKMDLREFQVFNYRNDVARYVTACLEHSEAARELSWWSKAVLNTLIDCYKQVHHLEEDHTYIKCACQRWLPDLKELYETEKQVQKYKMNHCKEELMMNRWHPNRVAWLLDQGIPVENM